ncbi:MAG: AAA family ATPase, partial [Planctomycetaceae bacterium]|nr:AAA family ATPase [Planctomycetaceae bacterium]
SRLVHALKQHVLSESAGQGDSILEWRSGPQHQNSSLFPVIDYLRQRLGFEPHEPGSSRLRKLNRQLQELRLDGDPETSLLASLLSLPPDEAIQPIQLPPQRQKEELFRLLRDFLRALSDRQPLLLVVEDLHWVDPTTLEFLEGFVNEGLHDRILTVMTFRPEFETPWKSRAHQTNLALNRLTGRQIRELVESRAGGSVPDEIIDQVIDRTDGIPLFVEEFTQMVLETVGAGDAEESGSTSGMISGHIVPATLHDMLMSRLDRMASRIEVVQLAAAIGRSFSWEIIRAASALSDDELQEELSKLVAAELLFSRGRGERVEFTFKHALIQDAAYNSLIRSSRQEFHRRIAAAIEKVSPETVDQQPELLAQHLTEAGENPRAVEFWERAGMRSLAQRAHREAIQQFQHGLLLLELMEESEARHRTEIRLLTAIGVPLQATVGYSAPEVEQSYSRAYELCQRLNITRELFPILYGMFRYYMLQAGYPQARELGARLLQIASDGVPLHYIVAAHRACGGPPVYEGRHAEAKPLLERVISIESTPELRAEVYRYDVVDPWIAARSYLSWACWLTGSIDQSIEHSNQAVQIAEGLDHSFSLVLALSFSQWVHQFRRDVRQTLATAETALKIAREHSFAFWIGWCRVMRGWALSQQNAADEGIREIREGLQEWLATGSSLGCHYYYALLAEACIAADDLPAAEAALTDAQDFADTTGEGFWIAEIARLGGVAEMRRDRPDHELAAGAFRRAMEFAQTQHADALELRAAVSLAELLQQQQKSREAQDVLQPIADRITEGAETTDVRDARRLLQVVSRNVAESGDQESSS